MFTVLDQCPRLRNDIRLHLSTSSTLRCRLAHDVVVVFKLEVPTMLGCVKSVWDHRHSASIDVSYSNVRDLSGNVAPFLCYVIYDSESFI